VQIGHGCSSISLGAQLYPAQANGPSEIDGAGRSPGVLLVRTLVVGVYGRCRSARTSAPSSTDAAKRAIDLEAVLD
jgi:hypothetical protein